MIEQIHQHWAAYVIAATILSAIAMLPWTYVMFMRWCRERQYQSHLRLSALVMARLSVFDAWVRSGGRKDALMEDLERSIREEYAAEAQRVGPNYYAEWCRHENAAEEALNALIETHGLPMGVTCGDPFKEDVCSYCEGTGVVNVELESLDKGKVEIKAPCHYCAYRKKS